MYGASAASDAPAGGEGGPARQSIPTCLKIIPTTPTLLRRLGSHMLICTTPPAVGNPCISTCCRERSKTEGLTVARGFKSFVKRLSKNFKHTYVLIGRGRGWGMVVGEGEEEGPICCGKLPMFSRFACFIRAQPLVNYLNYASADTHRRNVRGSQMLMRSRSEGGFCCPDRRERRAEGAVVAMMHIRAARRRLRQPLDFYTRACGVAPRAAPRHKCVRVDTCGTGGPKEITCARCTFTRANRSRRSCRVRQRAAVDCFWRQSGKIMQAVRPDREVHTYYYSFFNIIFHLRKPLNAVHGMLRV